MTYNAHPNLWRASHQQEADYAPLAQNLEVDLLVIGGGFTGCSAALEAAANGATVALVDANTIGHGGSGRNVGLVNAGLWLPPETITKTLGEPAGQHLITMLADAPDDVFSTIDTHRIQCSATRRGTLHLAHAPSGARNIAERYRQGKNLGAPLTLLNAEETAQRTGSNAFYGALFDPRAGTVQPLAYCRGLAAAAAKQGAQIFEQSSVCALKHTGEVWLADINGHVVTARQVLQATNAYQQRLSGMPVSEFVTVHYCQYATPPLTPEQRAQILPGGEGAWDTALVMSSIRVDEASRLIIGGVGNTDGPGAAVHERWARRKLASYYPEFRDVVFEHQWSGKIAMTDNHIPRVIQLGPNGLSVFGYSGRGIGPGTVFGKRAARALLFGELENLPVMPTGQHSEHFKQLRSAFYEAGSIVTHALRPFPLPFEHTNLQAEKHDDPIDAP